MREVKAPAVVLFITLLVLPVALATVTTNIACASGNMSGDENSISGNMNMTKSPSIAVIRATALNSSLLIADSMVLNVTSVTSKDTATLAMQYGTVFVGFSYRRVPVENGTISHYVINYVNLSADELFNITDVMGKLKEEGYEWHYEITEMVRNGTSTESFRNMFKERIMHRREMLRALINASLFEGFGNTARIGIWEFYNGTIIIRLQDHTDGFVKGILNEWLSNLVAPEGIELVHSNDTSYVWRLTNEKIDFMKLVDLTRSLWGKDTGPFALTLDTISGEPLKTHFGVYAIRFNTPGVETEHCVMVAGTVTPDRLRGYIESLNGEGYKVVLILRTILTPLDEAREVEAEDPQALLSALNSTIQDAPQVKRFIVVMRKKFNITIGEKCLADVSNGSIVIQRAGKAAIVIHVNGNATLYIESITAGNVTIESKKYNVTGEYLLEVSSEDVIEGTITLKFKIPEEVDPEKANISIAYYDNSTGEWVTVPTKIVQENGEYYAVAEVNHTSLWALVTPVEEETKTEGVAPAPTISDFIPHITVVLLILLALGLSAYAIRKRSM